MEKSAVVSLITPVYNVAPYIEEFLNSVVGQTFSDFEAVLVDDGSTDGSGEILDKYAALDKRIKVVHKENGGVVSAWKRGVEESCGEYLCFADPDDILDINMIMTQYSLAHENDADMVITGYKSLAGGNVVVKKAVRWYMAEGLCEGEELEQVKNKQYGDKEHKDVIIRVFRWNKIFKRELIVDNLKYTDDRVGYGDDICMFMAALYDSKRIYYKNIPLYTYRIRPQSITTVDFKPDAIDNADILVKAIHKVATDKGYINDFVLHGYHTILIAHLIERIAKSGASKKQKKSFLTKLAGSDMVANLEMRKTKRCVPFKRYMCVWMLRHKIYAPLLWYFQK